MKPGLRLGALLLLALALPACGFARHDVPASATDPAITGDPADQPHRAWAPNAGRRGQLLVHFPGSGGATAASELLAEQMAGDGFHVITLSYNPGFVTLRSSCDHARVQTYRSCALDFRGERWYGERYDHPDISVDRAHSAVNRLIKLLAHLDRNHPGEGWSAFRSDRTSAYGGVEPRWDRMLASGQSQGAGMALFAAREQPLLRAGMFSGSNDYSEGPGGTIAVADWIGGPFATPKGRIFGFSHTRENGHAGQLSVWARLGLAGGPTSVDGRAPPYGGAQRLVTSRLPRGCASDAGCGQSDYHGATAIDGDTPRQGGSPAFGPVWRQMLVPPPSR